MPTRDTVHLPVEPARPAVAVYAWTQDTPTPGLFVGFVGPRAYVVWPDQDPDTAYGYPAEQVRFTEEVPNA